MTYLDANDAVVVAPLPGKPSHISPEFSARACEAMIFPKREYGENQEGCISSHQRMGNSGRRSYHATKPRNLDHAAKPRSHKATCRHSLTGASQRHKAAKLRKMQNVVEFECTKSAAKASRNALACMAGHEPRLWCFSWLWRFETL